VELTEDEARICMQFASFLQLSMGYEPDKALADFTVGVFIEFRTQFNKASELMRAPKTPEVFRKLAELYGTQAVLEEASRGGWIPVSSCEFNDQPHNHAECTPRGEG
jgi:hypothetical protein